LEGYLRGDITINKNCGGNVDENVEDAIQFETEAQAAQGAAKGKYSRNAHKRCALIGKPRSARPNRTALP